MRTSLFALVAATLVSTGVVAGEPAPASLYDRLGGKAAITAVVDDFVARLADDPRVNQKFGRSNLPRVKAMLVDQVCEAAGGPCTYTGRSMQESHRGMRVSEGEFDALVEQLGKTLAAFKVPQAEQDQLLTVLAPMKRDIVEVRGQATGTPLPETFAPAPPLPPSR